MKSDYRSSNFDRMLATFAFFISIVPIMLLLAFTSYPIMTEYTEMTTITVVTKRCFWMCVISIICSLGILVAYLKKSFERNKCLCSTTG